MSQPIQDPTDSSRWVVGDVTEPTFGVHVGSGVLTKVHSAGSCVGRSCVMHAPSAHSMRSWPLTWRGDKGVFERACLHGVGHPDPDDAAYQVLVGRGYNNVHGCDGCCG